MKQSVRCRILALTALILGAVGAVLRGFYFKLAQDGKGFLITGHPLQILFWVLAGVMILWGLMLSLKAKKVSIPGTGGIPGGLVRIFLGLTLAAAMLQLDPNMGLKNVVRILGLLAAGCLAADGVFRCAGKNPGFYADILLSIFLIVYMISLYTLWRSIPEMERFLTPAAALLLLTPFSCEMAFADDREEADGKFLFLGSISCFFSVSSLGCPGFTLLHLGAAAYTAFGLFMAGRGEKHE